MLIYETIYGVCFTNDQFNIYNKFTIDKERPCYSGKSTIKIITSHIFYLCSFSLICKKKLKYQVKLLEMNYQKWINPNINIECYILNVGAPINALGEKTNDAKLRQKWYITIRVNYSRTGN